MKKPFVFSIYFTILIVNFSMADKPVLVVANLNNNETLFFYKQSKFFYTQQDDEYLLESKNDSILVHIKQPNILIFQESLNKRIPIIVFPGDTLIISREASGNLSFAGTKSFEWNMMREIVSDYSITETYMYNRVYKNINDLESEIEANKSNFFTIIEKYQKEYNISMDYVTYLKNEINYHFIKSWAYHKKNSSQQTTIPSYIKKELQLALNDSLNIGSVSRHSAIYRYVQAECDCIKDVFPTKDEFVVIFEFIKKNYKGINQTQLLLSVLYEQIKITSAYGSDNNFFKSYLDYFYSQNKEDDYKNFMNSITNKRISFEDLSLDSVNFLTLSNQIESLKFVNSQKKKYKLIFIDIWASWCAPCLDEFPASKKLQEIYQNMGVYFIYLSVDKDKRKWNQASQKIGLSNFESFLLFETEKNHLIKMLKVNSIPRYILIDVDGRIIDNNAPKPSDLSVHKIIKKALDY